MNNRYAFKMLLRSPVKTALTVLLLVLLVLLPGCQKKKASELTAYLAAAYPTRAYMEEGRYYLRRSDGSAFAIAPQETEEKDWNTLSLHYETIDSTVDCACALHYVLNVDLSLGVIGESYGWQPSLHVYLGGTWWSMESGEPDYHPIGIAMPNYGCGATRYLYDLTSRETRAPLPDGRYRLVFDFGEIYDACCIFYGDSLSTDCGTLVRALTWCYRHRIPLINLSLGTTEERDFTKVERIVSKMTAQGQIIVSAYHTNGSVTMPASHPDVIGVRTSPELTENSFYPDCSHGKHDFVASSQHQLVTKSGQIEFQTELSSSYAVPTITAAFANCMLLFSSSPDSSLMCSD